MGPKMPVSVVCESPAGISSAIRNSLTNNLSATDATAHDDDIQNQLLASAKRALLAKIEYQESVNRNVNNDALKSKYIVLKTTPANAANANSATGASTAATNAVNGSATANVTASTANNSKLNGIAIVSGGGLKDKLNLNNSTDQSSQGKKDAELPTPKVVLYKRNQVQIGWKSSTRKWSVGAGMINLVNTCYLNSTLQALFHVPAFANWLVSDVAHRETCEAKTGIQGGCINCAVAKTFLASQQSQQPIKPHLVYSKLRVVCKHLLPGQQEDAHEFLRYLMEAMEKAYLNRFPNSKQFDQISKETTPVNQILGGYLKTSVRCLSCHHVSVTFQHFEDLLLDVRKANTVEEALDMYFARERLEDMGYKCEGCKKKVTATKQYSLERPPIALCIQLKRFSMAGNKINKHITIREHLNLSKYSSKRTMNHNEQLSYRLVSMITHLGATQLCGHYTAIGLTDTGAYYQFDDSCVRPISLPNVLNTDAYIIFYELETNSANSSSTWKSSQQTVIGHNKVALEQHSSISSMSTAKVCPSTQTSAKDSDPNVAVKRKIETNHKINGTEVTTEHSCKSVSSSSNHTPHTQTASSHKTVENLTERDAAVKPTSATTIVNGAGPLCNSNRKNDTAITATTNNQSLTISQKSSATPLANMNNGHQSQAQLPSLPTLDDTYDCLFEAKVNGAFNRTTNTSSNSDSNHQPSRMSSSTNGDTASKANAAPTIGNVPLAREKVQRKLVPYTSDEDDSDEEDCILLGSSSPSETMKSSRSGPFQVTSTLPLKLVADRKSVSPTVQISSATLVTFKRNNSDSALNEDVSPSNRDSCKLDDAKSSAIAKINVIQKRPISVMLNNGQDADDPAKKLLKLSHRGYGTNVSSWNGGVSAMEKEVVEDKKEEQARQTLDANDAEMDRGQTKKVKNNAHLGRTNPGYNPFTEQQLNRNAWNASNGSKTNGTVNKSTRPPYQIIRQTPNQTRSFNQPNRYSKRSFGSKNQNFHRRH